MYLRNLWCAWLAWWRDIKSFELLRFLLGGDRFVNALAGGHYLFTISGRVGAFASYDYRGWYWSVLQWMIDQAFYPLEGPKHCYKAMLWEKSVIDRKKKHRRGNDVAIMFLSILVFLGCLIIAPVVYLLSQHSKFSRS